MSTSFGTATEFRKQLETNLRNRSTNTGEDIHRLRRKVAFDRLLARIFTQEQSAFLLKGGYAMELRIAHARATKDIDLTYFKRMSNAKEPITDIILQELQTLARINLNDHFSYQIGQPQSDIENAPYGGSRHNVLTVIDNRPFVEFHLDVGGDFLIDHIDLILLLNSKNRTPEAFRRALQRVFKARNTHLLPTVLPEPPLSWQKPFVAMATECGISQSLQDGFTKVSEFYKRLPRNP